MKIIRNEKIKVDYIALFVCPIITFYLFDWFTHNPFTSMDVRIQLLNIVFYELVALFSLGMFKSVRISLLIQSAFFMFFGIANYYVVSFRGAPIRPWDIFSVKTAASVADNYDYSLETKAVLILLLFVLLLIAESRFREKVCAKSKRFLLVLLPFMLLWGYAGMIQNDSFVLKFGLYDKFFTPTVVNKRCGNAVAFMMAMEYMEIERPEGYSAEQVELLLASDDKAENGTKPMKTPNIIVIMNEAFSDLAVLGEMTTNQDYMPFIHSLQEGAENTITGDLHVSVLGGNTANTEFEFLTGSTMAFLPQGSVAYQQYVQNKMPSVASYLKEMGYNTVAMHPYNASGWDRDRVYSLLGFDSFLSINDFKGAKKLRKYVADEACYDRIIELYEEKEAGEPLFVFNVTMQNHSGYTDEFENFAPDITVEGITGKSLPMYLSLIKESDRAFGELVAYFEEADEDTMIVFFGDHQPATYVSNPIFRKNGIDPDTLTEDENLERYKVPYVIWSNFDIEERTGLDSSVNYLMLDVLEQCGLPMRDYHRNLQKLREQYPVISAFQVRDAAGKYWKTEDLEMELNEYRSLQYYFLFDYEE